jgi:hypothetical protein
MKWICRFIGHKYTELDVLVAQIELKALITKQPKIICKRCGVDVIAESLEKQHETIVGRRGRKNEV